MSSSSAGGDDQEELEAVVDVDQEGGAEPCDHYDAHVGVRIVDLEDEDVDDRRCAWCFADELAIGFVKSERYVITFCEECSDILRILASAADRGDQEGGEHGDE